MSVISQTFSGLSVSSVSGSAMLPTSASPTLGRGAKAAREFEAQLIGTVLESLERDFAALPGKDPVAGEDNYNYLSTRALASAIADRGGFGIAKMIAPHLSTRK